MVALANCPRFGYMIYMINYDVCWGQCKEDGSTYDVPEIHGEPVIQHGKGIPWKKLININHMVTYLHFPSL